MRKRVTEDGRWVVQTDDMIFISVDDHLVEPPDMFEGRLPAKFADRAPRVEHTRDGSDVWIVQRHDHPQRRPERGRWPAQGGVRHRADRVRRDAARLLRHPRAHQGHERRRRARLDVLPLVPRVRRPSVRWLPTTRISRWRCVQAYNDWHIDEWCGSYPGRFIPMALPVLWDADLRRGRGAPRRGQGLPLDDVHREPGRARLPELPRGLLGPAVDGVCDDGVARRSTSAPPGRPRSPHPTRRST